MRSGAGTWTRSISSRARRCAAAGPSPRWRTSVSTIWSPIVNTGSRAVIGSWKTIEATRPRSARRSGSSRRFTSRSLSSTSPEIRVCDDGCRPRIERSVTLLPEPDSPSRARTTPLSTSNVTPLGARTTPSRVSTGPPVLRYSGLYARDPALRGHPPFGVEAVPVAGLLGVVNGRLASERGEQRPQGRSIEQGPSRAGHDQRGGRHAGRKGAQVEVGQGTAHGLGARREHPEVVVDLFQRVRLGLGRERRRLVEQRWRGHHARRA